MNDGFWLKNAAIVLHFHHFHHFANFIIFIILQIPGTAGTACWRPTRKGCISTKNKNKKTKNKKQDDVVLKIMTLGQQNDDFDNKRCRKKPQIHSLTRHFSAIGTFYDENDGFDNGNDGLSAEMMDF